MQNAPPAEVANFLKWYEERAQYPWDHLYELKEYCKQDVAVLAAALRVYVNSGNELTGINPMTQTTSAGYALGTYLHHDLPKDSLAVLSKSRRISLVRGCLGVALISPTASWS